MSEREPAGSAAARTRLGRAGFGDNYFRGELVIRDLGPAEPAWSLYSQALGGPRLDPEQVEVMQAIGTHVLVFDPRIWLFKQAVIQGSYGSAMGAIGASVGALEGAIVGPWAIGDIGQALLQVRQDVGLVPERGELEAWVEAWFEEHPTLPGFGVVGRPYDERQVELTRWFEDHRPADGPFWRLSRQLAHIVMSLRGLRPNGGYPVAAIWLDMGYDVAQMRMLGVCFMFPLILGMGHEAALEQAPALRRVPAHMARYEGPAPRVSPRAERAASAAPEEP